VTPAIEVENLGKSYRITHGQLGYRTLRETLTDLATAPLRRLRNGSPSACVEEFWALRGVNLRVEPGEVVGVIGRNGAGKSTFLKVLSRITRPTTGRVILNGRVGSLLEVGTGFHPELTGRENIYLNGAILGMSRREISDKFEQIVEFAEVSQFLDTPVKRYSSGMYVRLAFAVAAHLQPEILLIDEVLAVGDAAFQRKCLGKMADVARAGRTILFISHNMGAVLRLCSRCIWLNDGQVQAAGNTRQIVNAYTSSGTSDLPQKQWSPADAPGDETVKLLAVRVCQPCGAPSASIDITQSFDIEIETEYLQALPEATVGVQIRTGDGEIVYHSAAVMNPEVQVPHAGRWQHVCRIPAYALNAGTYFLTVAGDVPNHRLIFSQENVLRWTVEALCPEMGRYGAGAWPGVLGPGLGQWSVEELSPSFCEVQK
jgi:lipopolysaccharide transport system ATP-binding protein